MIYFCQLFLNSISEELGYGCNNTRRAKKSLCRRYIESRGIHISSSPDKKTYTAFCEESNSSIVVCIVSGMKVRFSISSKREDLFKLCGEAVIILRSDFSNVQNVLPPLLAFDAGPILPLEDALMRMQEKPTCEIMYVPLY